MHLTQSLHRVVQQTPDEIATICGDRVRTHREVADRIARLAGALRALGLREGDRVGLLAANSDRFHEFLYAVWWMGGVVNPVNTRWSSREMVYSLEESGTRVLFVDDAFAARVPELRSLWDGISTVVHCGDGGLPAGMADFESLIEDHEPVADVRRGGDDLAGLFYTGGTTGFPKGVMLSHRSIMTSSFGLLATNQSARRGGRALHVAPLFHLAALAAWNSQCVMGGSHVFLPAFDPAEVRGAIERHQVTNLLLVPAMIQALLDHPEIGAHDLSTVEHVGYGASVISEPLLARAMKAFPGARFSQGYGMTEMSPGITVLTNDDHADERLLRSAGRAIAATEVRIVDPEDVEVPRGTIGQVVARGDNVMLGYWNKPRETAEALRGGWMHTGDAGYMDDDGYVFIVDRIKDMIVSGGENVYSAEVENALAKHPAVASCAVIGVPDEQWGERVHAVIVLKPGHTAAAAELREHAKTLIAGYKAPRSFEFVDAMPLSPAGKILKRDLREPYWNNSGRSVN
ncbi:long-chain fatty acid--CoA ligase [Saccharopolyspora sp. NPDC050389]|uniref:acyl-CoA synthetase n=1 Tax=Saccharopolyspora sp. NPDC050389 TaxID=3155516 RepID=UPI0033F51585